MDDRLLELKRNIQFDNEAFPHYLTSLSQIGILKRFDITLTETTREHWPWYNPANDSIINLGSLGDHITVLNLKPVTTCIYEWKVPSPELGRFAEKMKLAGSDITVDLDLVFSDHPGTDLSSLGGRRVIKSSKTREFENGPNTIFFTFPYFLSWEQRKDLFKFFGKGNWNECNCYDVYGLQIWRLHFTAAMMQDRCGRLTPIPAPIPVPRIKNPISVAKAKNMIDNFRIKLKIDEISSEISSFQINCRGTTI